jgi:hypothetical protein
MKALILSTGLFLIFSQVSFAQDAQDKFPIGPNPQMTPGSLCQQPDSYRYAEQIPYCNRAVSSDLKNDVIHTYDQQLDFTIEQMDRQKFKIDHFIPLCAGGGNDRENLWPQHESVYTITDPVEPLICDKMAAGTLKQADAITYVRRAKLDLSQVPAVLQELNAL